MRVKVRHVRRGKGLGNQCPHKHSETCLCVHVCVFKKTIGRLLSIGQCVSTLSTCIDFCHVRVGFGPLGVC